MTAPRKAKVLQTEHAGSPAPHPLIRLPFPLEQVEPTGPQAPQAPQAPHRYRALVRSLAALVVADLTDPKDV